MQSYSKAFLPLNLKPKMTHRFTTRKHKTSTKKKKHALQKRFFKVFFVVVFRKTTISFGIIRGKLHNKLKEVLRLFILFCSKSLIEVRISANKIKNFI